MAPRRGERAVPAAQPRSCPPRCDANCAAPVSARPGDPRRVLPARRRLGGDGTDRRCGDRQRRGQSGGQPAARPAPGGRHHSARSGCARAIGWTRATCWSRSPTSARSRRPRSSPAACRHWRRPRRGCRRSVPATDRSISGTPSLARSRRSGGKEADRAADQPVRDPQRQ